MTNQLEFDQAYWASQPPEIRAMPAIEEQPERAKRAAELAVKGFSIDVPIMVYGWDPFLVMKLRSDFGYAWVPSALQPPVSAAPNATVPGAIPYDANHPPAGSIRVSLTVQDYPPFIPPAQPTPQTPAGDNPVGLQSVGTLYLSVPGENYPDGARYTDSRGTFAKHVTVTPFGRTNYWEKIS